MYVKISHRINYKLHSIGQPYMLQAVCQFNLRQSNVKQVQNCLMQSIYTSLLAYTRQMESMQRKALF